jgi:valyl-tRNA synthetase
VCLVLPQGRVDLSSHLEKTEEKLAKSKDKLSKLQDQLNAVGYMDKVGSDVKEADEERLRNLTAEVETLSSFVASLRRLHI